jgi:hypothetical protein
MDTAERAQARSWAADEFLETDQAEFGRSGQLGAMSSCAAE